MSWLKKAMDETDFGDDLSDCEDKEQVIALLTANGYENRDIAFPNGEAYVIAEKGDETLIIDPDFPTPTPAQEWISMINDWKLAGYIGEIPDFNAEFWGGKEFAPKLYHGTWSKDADTVMKDGLKPHNETRGMSNRSTGSAIFTTTYDQTDGEGYKYGEAVIEIDTVAMQGDGYTPEVSKEYPLEVENQRDNLAWKMGIKDFYNHRRDELENDGICDTTIIVYKEIPVKYLKRLS